MCVGYVLSWALIVLLFHSLLPAPIVCVCYVLSCAVIVILFLPVYCCSQCMCRLCIDVGVDCVVAVFLCSVAPIGCVGYVLSWAMIVLLLFHCILLLPLCVQVVYCP